MGAQDHCQPGGTTFSVRSSIHLSVLFRILMYFIDVYTAATVLIAGRLCPSIVEEVTDSAISRSWVCALETLRKYQSYSSSARRCVAALEILYERVVSEAPPSCEPPPIHQTPSAPVHTTNDMSLDAILMDSFGLADFQDMSWLNSVPSSLY